MHKGSGFGESSETVVVDAKHMSDKWSVSCLSLYKNTVHAKALVATPEHVGTDKVGQPCQMGNLQHPSMDPSEDTVIRSKTIISL